MGAIMTIDDHRGLINALGFHVTEWSAAHLAGWIEEDFDLRKSGDALKEACGEEAFVQIIYTAGQPAKFIVYPEGVSWSCPK